MLILCPFLAGQDPAVGMWLGPLAWHDCNATLIAALAHAALPHPATVFAGVFCAEPFQLERDLLDTLRAAGVAGIANLPSVSFLDGDFGQTLSMLNLGIERELGFLRRAGLNGFRRGPGRGRRRTPSDPCRTANPGKPAERDPAWSRSNRAGLAKTTLVSLYDITS